MERQLTRRDVWFIGILLGITVISLVVGVRLFSRAFPEATIRFDIDRKESQERATTLLDDLGFDVSHFRHAEQFRFHPTTKVFLEKEMGLALADSAYTGELRFWRWAHRWFRPLKEEGFRVEFATTGELAFFDHLLEEEAPGGEIPEEEARALAETFVRETAAVDLDLFELVGTKEKVRAHRVDRTFTWERVGRKWAGAPLRVQAVVQGDRIGGFVVFLQVPEAWQRSYASLRSRNEATGAVASVLYGLLIIGLAIAFVKRIGRRTIQWRIALGFACAGMVLVFLGELNGFQSSLFGYDTHQDLSSFLVMKILQVVGQCVMFGLFIFLLTAGGEAVYREAFPGKVSLGGFFTRQGMRTRRFFLSILAGYAMTAFFFAYQAIFYCAADALGAWAPADVPYDNMLNTSLPWAFVLLVGFAPAVVEEFTARMFAIPALGRLFRSRALAVIVAAAIWGFAHANYPNQPFYIRGFEVGLAGVLVGVVMLRLNVLAVLVWHYTVDALYAAYLLLRSGDPYFVISGALAAGLLLVPFIYALLAFLRKRSFESPEGLLNRDIAVPERGVRPPREPVPVVAYAPLSGRRWGVIFLVTGLVVAGIHFLPVRQWNAVGRYEIKASEARRIGKEHLRELGAPLESLKVAAWHASRIAPETYRYGAQMAGLETTHELLEREVGPLGWVVRAFAPERKEEWRVMLGASDGSLLGFEHDIQEEAPRDSLPQEDARRIAEAFLESQGYDIAAWSLVVSRAEPRPARKDFFFTWEAADSTHRLGEGAVRLEIGVWGDQIGRWARFFKLPEEWQHARANRTPFDAVRTGLLGLLILGAVVYGASLLTKARGLGRVGWRVGLSIGLVAVLVSLAGFLVNWESMLQRYDTSQPWNLFLMENLFLVPFGMMVIGLALGVGLSLLSVPHPGLWTSLHRRNRTFFATDAVLSLLVVVGWLAIVGRLGDLLHGWLPGAFPRIELAVPPGIDSRWALIPSLAGAFMESAAAALVVGLALFLVHGAGKVRPLGLLLVLIATVALLPGSARTLGEVLATWFTLLATALAAVILARVMLRDNVPAYVLLCVAVGAGEFVRRLACSPVTRLDAVLLVAVIVVAIVVFFVRGTRPAGVSPGQITPHATGSPAP